jgi:MFS family permease
MPRADNLAPTPPSRGKAGRLLAVLATAQLIIILDGTIVAIALPQMQRALGFSAASLQWVVNAYALAFGGALLAAGRLTDRLGRRRCLIAGLLAFGVVSVLGGAAQSSAWLVAARAGQGLCAALVAPAALGLLTTTFVEAKQRARAFAVYGSIGTFGAGVGLLLGGLLTSYLSWRSVTVFAVTERRVVNPLLPGRLLASASRLSCFAAAILGGAGVLGMFFFISQYMQNIRGYSPLATGLAFIPNIVSVAVAAKIAERLLHRLGPRPILVTGLLLSAVGVTALGLGVRPHAEFSTHILPANVLLSAGIGLTFVTLANAALDGVDHTDAGVASGLFAACQQVGGAAGLALFATVAASVTSARRDPAGAAAVTAGYDAGFFLAAGFFVVAAAVVFRLVRAARGELDEEAHAMVLL